MLEAVTIAIVFGAVGLLVGAFLPGVVAYAILFLRRHGLQLRTLLKLGGRLLLAYLVLGTIVVVILEGPTLLGVSGELASDLEFNSFLIGGQTGLWGSIVALILGFWRARKHRGTTEG